MKIATAALTLLLSTTAPVQPVDRGTVVSATELTSLTEAQTSATLTQDQFDAGTVRHGVTAYRIVYRTIDAHGAPTTASGLLVLPDTRSGQLDTVSFDHGTESYRPDAPSTMQQDGFLSDPAITYAAAGYAAVAPDYLGLGEGPGTHPWMDVPSETTASLDLLRAARAFVPSTGHTLSRQVLLTGFSQGASAALGLARALQSGADPWFRATAVAPISGAYDFGGAEREAMLDGQLTGQVAVPYATYLLVAWNRLHHLYDSPRDVFQPAYADKVDVLFNGDTPGPVMIRTLPTTLHALLTAKGYAMLAHPTGSFASALRTADSVCTNWTPRLPIRLYEASNDEQAVNANTTHCAADLAAPVVNLGTPDYHGSRHLGSAVAGTAAIARWFTQLDPAR